jgi:hypothetical protein
MRRYTTCGCTKCGPDKMISRTEHAFHHIMEQRDVRQRDACFAHLGLAPGIPVHGHTAEAVEQVYEDCLRQYLEDKSSARRAARESAESTAAQVGYLLEEILGPYRPATRTSRHVILDAEWTDESSGSSCTTPVDHIATAEEEAEEHARFWAATDVVMELAQFHARATANRARKAKRAYDSAVVMERAGRGIPKGVLDWGNIRRVVRVERKLKRYREEAGVGE